MELKSLTFKIHLCDVGPKWECEALYDDVYYPLIASDDIQDCFDAIKTFGEKP